MTFPHGDDIARATLTEEQVQYLLRNMDPDAIGTLANWLRGSVPGLDIKEYVLPHYPDALGTDITVQVQAGINAAAALTVTGDDVPSGGNTLYFRPSIYPYVVSNLTTDVSPNQSVSLIGLGITPTVIRQKAGASGTLLTARGYQGMRIENLRFEREGDDGQNTGIDFGVVSHGTSQTSGRFCEMRNVWVRGFDVGVRAGWLEDGLFERLYLYLCNTGLDVTSKSRIMLRDIVARACTRGIKVRKEGTTLYEPDVTIHGGTLDANDIGLLIDSASGVRVRDVYASSNSRSAIEVRQGVGTADVVDLLFDNVRVASGTTALQIKTTGNDEDGNAISYGAGAFKNWSLQDNRGTAKWDLTHLDQMRISRIENQNVNYFNLDDFSYLVSGGDWAPAVQAIFARVSADATTGAGAKSFVLYVPGNKDRNIGSECLLIGSPTASVLFYGDGCGDLGSKFTWTGAAGGTMFHFRGVTRSQIRGLRFYGNDIPKYCFRLQYYQIPAAGTLGSTDVSFDECVFANAAGNGTANNNDGSAAFALGDDTGGSNFQSDNIRWNHCRFEGNPLTMDAGWKAIDGGNNKNLWFHDCQWTGGISAIDWRRSSQILSIENGFAGNQGRQIILMGQGNAQLRISGFEVEGGVYSNRFLNQGAGQVPLTTTMDSVYAQLTCPDATEADLPGQPAFASFLGLPADIMNRVAAGLTMSGCHWENFRTIDAGATRPFLAKCAVNADTSAVNGVGSIVSTGNTFINSSKVAPFIRLSSGGESLLGYKLDDITAATYLKPEEWSAITLARVSSENDVGGVQGALERLLPVRSDTPHIVNLATRTRDTLLGQNADTTGISPKYLGKPIAAGTAFAITKAAFSAAAASKIIKPCAIPAGARVRSVRIKITEAFADGAGDTFLMRVGHTNGGNEYLLDFNAGALGTYGDLNTELGKNFVTQIRNIPGPLAATFDVPDLAPGAGFTTIKNINGALLGDFVLLGSHIDLQGVTMTGYVSSADNVALTFVNGNAGNINLASAQYNIAVIPAGALDARTAQGQGGYVQSNSNSTFIYIKLLSSGANLSTLTAGAFDVIVEYSRFDDPS